jgi:hypothetical protein
MNFMELMKYAIQNGEEKWVWDKANKLRLTNKVISLLIATYPGAFGIGSNENTDRLSLERCLVTRFLEAT